MSRWITLNENYDFSGSRLTTAIIDCDEITSFEQTRYAIKWWQKPKDFTIIALTSGSDFFIKGRIDDLVACCREATRPKP